MPKDRALSWYKWWPFKARGSKRFDTLTITEEGAYRRLYDHASMAENPSRRGELWFSPNVPYDDDEIARSIMRVNRAAWVRIREKLIKRELLSVYTNGTNLQIYYFPDYAKHQHDAGLRQRKKPAQNRPKTGLKPAYPMPEEEEEEEEEKEAPPTPSSEGDSASHFIIQEAREMEIGGKASWKIPAHIERMGPAYTLAVLRYAQDQERRKKIKSAAAFASGIFLGDGLIADEAFVDRAKLELRKMEGKR